MLEKQEMLITRIFPFSLNIFYPYNPLPDDKTLAISNLKALADDESNGTLNYLFVSHRVENILGKGEHAGHQHVLFFPQSSKKKKNSFPRASKVRIV